MNSESLDILEISLNVFPHFNLFGKTRFTASEPVGAEFGDQT